MSLVSHRRGFGVELGRRGFGVELGRRGFGVELGRRGFGVELGRRAIGVWLLSAWLGCDRRVAQPAPAMVDAPAPQLGARAPTPLATQSSSTSSPTSSSITGAVSSAAPGASPKATEELRRVPAPARLVAIGDLHGDLDATRAALRLAGALDTRDHWAGGPLVVVQVGDQLDRGDDERAILDWFERWAAEARAAGGAFIPLNGNHEVMNVEGDFRYVTSGGFRTFVSVEPTAPASTGLSGPQKERAAALLPGGGYAVKLATRDVVAIVGNTVFTHGGILPAHVEFGLQRINRSVQAWMRGEAPTPPAAVIGERSPLWIRDYGVDHVTEETCAALDVVLTRLGVRRLVVGHTIQDRGINSACNDRVFRVDVGLSRAYGDRPIQVLELVGDRATVLTGSRSQLLGGVAPMQAASATR